MPAPPPIPPDSYSIVAYGVMLGDGDRASAYSKALGDLTMSTSFVIDIGTGPGTFALLACRLGARRVVGIEPDDVIEIARETAADNGLADRVEFIQDVSTRVAFEEPADVIVSDLRGALPLYRQHIPSIVDARERLLAPTGSLIPQQDRLLAAVVTDANTYQRSLEGWRRWPELDQNRARSLAANSLLACRVEHESIVSDPVCWATLDYRTIEHANVEGRLECVASGTATAYGVGLGFEAILADGASFSTLPWRSDSLYANLLLPFEEPLDLAQGDHVSIALRANLVGDDYVWRWETTAWRGDDRSREIARYSQSNLHAILPSHLRRITPDHVPTLNESGRRDALILTRMSAGASLEEIAREVSAQFPDLYQTWEDAWDHVAVLSSTYGS
jgi:protein arginine N-methyltransferase 1